MDEKMLELLGVVQDQNDKELSAIKSNADESIDLLGLHLNVFDARGFKTTTPANWEVDATKNSLTVIHKNSYSTGSPNMVLNIEPGVYVFKAGYSGSSVTLELREDNAYKAELKNGREVEILPGKKYNVLFFTTVEGTFTIRDISMVRKPDGGILGETANELSAIKSDIAALMGTSATPLTDAQKAAVQAAIGILSVEGVTF